MRLSYRLEGSTAACDQRYAEGAEYGGAARLLARMATSNGEAFMNLQKRELSGVLNAIADRQNIVGVVSKRALTPTDEPGVGQRRWFGGVP
jgi:hypothetical protein